MFLSPFINYDPETVWISEILIVCVCVCEGEEIMNEILLYLIYAMFIYILQHNYLFKTW